ncbi:hypothetical protein CEXT_776411 [Caerostris extrusa]|uniref:Uncharacterized protein n=1 Tax=Caerostris extrusa TaxID=172846 RepID=A0AAV4MRM3_CAEEX|nr:hypothetical protein CEXT_776411 [Caerostris extrusa]
MYNPRAETTNPSLSLKPAKQGSEIQHSSSIVSYFWLDLNYVNSSLCARGEGARNLPKQGMSSVCSWLQINCSLPDGYLISACYENSGVESLHLNFGI